MTKNVCFNLKKLIRNKIALLNFPEYCLANKSNINYWETRILQPIPPHNRSTTDQKV